MANIPVLHMGYPANSYPKLESAIPRVYHRHLNDMNMENIYGKDAVDEANSNVTLVEVEPLTPQQEDIIKEMNEPVEEYIQVYEEVPALSVLASVVSAWPFLVPLVLFAPTSSMIPPISWPGIRG